MKDSDLLLADLEAALANMEEIFGSHTTISDRAALEERIQKGETDWTIFKDYAFLNKRVETFEKLKQAADLAVDYATEVRKHGVGEDFEDARQMVAKCIRAVNEYVLQEQFTEQYDLNDTIVTLQIGEGTQNLTHELDRVVNAYVRYGESKGIAVEVMESDGKRNYTLRAKGDYAYGYFKGEHGVHKFNLPNKRQYGHICVTVEPKVDLPDYDITKKDLKIEPISASTNGGQHANSSKTGVRITHNPSGKNAQSKTRSWKQSMQNAMEVLRSRVARFYEAQQEQHGEDRVDACFGHKFRIYNLIKGTVKDLRTQTVMPLDSYLSGNLDPFVIAYRQSIIKKAAK